MSLLIKALEQAAKDRSAAQNDGSADPAAAGNPARPATTSREPTLEPPPPPRSTPSLETPTPTSTARAFGGAAASEAAPTHSAADRAPIQRRATPAAALANIDAQQRARAAVVMQAGGSAAQNVIAYMRGNPIVMLAGMAVLFGIGFGIYVYLQIAKPGLFVRQAATRPEQTAPPTPPPAPAQPPGLPTAAPMPEGPTGIASQPSVSPTLPVSGSIGAAPGVAAVLPPEPMRPAAGPTPPASGSPGPAGSAGGPLASSSIIGSGPRSDPSAGRIEPPSERPLAAPRERSVPREAAAPAKPAASPVATADPASGGRERIAVSPTTVQPRLNPQLSQAYALLQSGNYGEARGLYDRVIQSEPLNIDALLGSAYIAAQENRSEDALKAYLRILQLNPRHSVAQAALIGLMGRADPIASETRLKQLLAREPSPFLHFVLGNLYADQALWSQAQQAYFQAHHLEPDNPDYAYNLAIGLDHLRQSKLALDFYRRAERLAAQSGRSNFSLAHARERISSLSSQLE